LAKVRKRKKKKIKEDSFVTLWVRVSQYTQQHYTQIAAALVVVALGVGFLLFASHSRQVAARESEKLLGQAIGAYRRGEYAQARETFAQVAERYSRLRNGAIALYFKGQCDLNMGNYAEASTAFEGYLRKAGKYPLFEQSALVGKALALEGLGQYREAGVVLNKVLKEMDKEDPRYRDIAYMAANLLARDPETRARAIQLYEELAQQGRGRIANEAKVAAAILKGR